MVNDGARARGRLVSTLHRGQYCSDAPSPRLRGHQWPYPNLPRTPSPTPIPPPFSLLQDLKHVFPASRLLISTVTTELADLSRGYASFKRLVEGDPNLRPRPPEASPTRGDGPPPSPGCLSRTLSRTGSTSSAGGGMESEGAGDGNVSSPGSSRSVKLATLSRQKTENRKSKATTGKVRRY